jgi:hypothetical protein
VKITIGNGLEPPKSPELQLNAPAQKTATQPSMLLNIFPNPTRSDLYLNFENHAESTSRATVRIMHPTGTVLRQLSLDAIPGKNASSLNVQSMPIGWYLLEVQLNGERQVVKWMKQD